jgi:hypothetical protein
MIDTDDAEERLARVERMLAKWRRESAAGKAVAASKVVAVRVNSALSLDTKHHVRPARPGHRATPRT